MCKESKAKKESCLGLPICFLTLMTIPVQRRGLLIEQQRCINLLELLRIFNQRMVLKQSLFFAFYFARIYLILCFYALFLLSFSHLQNHRENSTGVASIFGSSSSSSSSSSNAHSTSFSPSKKTDSTVANLLRGAGVKSVCEHSSIVGDATEETLIAIQAKKKAQEERLANLEKVMKEKELMDMEKEEGKRATRKALKGRSVHQASGGGSGGKTAKMSPHDALMSALLEPSSSSAKKKGAVRKLPVN